jgi:hypothetical protein
VLGRRSSEAGPAWAGLRAREKTGRRPGIVHGLKEKEKERRGKRDGSAGGKEREERGEEFSFSFKFLFKFIFQTFKLQSNRNPCIRIMMHKHLLFSRLF